MEFGQSTLLNRRKIMKTTDIKKSASIKYCLLHGVYWMCFCLLFSFSSVYLLGKGFTDRQIGFVLALGGVIAVFLQSKVAEIADRSNKITLRHIIIIISFLSIFVAVINLVFGTGVGRIRLFYITLVVLLQIMMPLINAVGMECVNNGIELNFGLARGIGSVTFSLLSLVVGSFLEGRNPNLIMFLGIFLYAVLILIAFSFKFDITKSNKSSKNDEISENIDIDIKKEKKNYRFYFMLVGVVLIFSSHILLNNFLFQITKNIGGSSEQMGIAMAICAFVELPTMMSFGFLIRKIRANMMIKISALFFALKTLATYFCGGIFSLYAVQLMQIFGFALFTPASVYYVNSVSPENQKAKGQALLGVAITLGGVLGNYFGGLFIETFGVTRSLLIFSIIGFVGAGIISLTAKNTEDII